MSIVKMKRLRLIAVRSQRDELLKELMLLGCVEVSEPPSSEEDQELAVLTKRESGGAEIYKSQIAALSQGLAVLNKYAPAKKKLLQPLPQVELNELLNEGELENCLSASKELVDLDDQIKRTAAEITRLQNLIESLRPWSSLDMPLNFTGTNRTSVTMCTFPAAADMLEAERALNDTVPEAQLFEISEDKQLKYMLLISLKECLSDAGESLRPFGFAVVSPLSAPGTPADNITLAEKNIEELDAKRESIAEEIVARADIRDTLKLNIDMLSTKTARAESAERLLATESSVLLTGWITAPEEDKLAEICSRYDCAWETEDPDPEHPEEVPVKLKSRKLANPYNMITEMYSLPAYNGLDPNPFIMPFFALFFGMMFADMAYGLIMLAAGLILTFKAKPKGTMKFLAGLMIQGGIATFIMGFLTGGFFGDAISVVGKIFGQEWSIVPPLGSINIAGVTIDLPLNLLEGNNPLYVLIFAMVLGVIHLAIGVGIGVYLNIKDGKWLDAIADISWWIIFAGIAVMVLGGGNIVLYVGIAVMVISAFLKGKGLGRLTGIFGAVYNGLTGYLGDILSYSRLMALMLAGSVIASVFNQLGALGGIVLFIPVFLIGHLLNFGLNVIGCFVHTMRLQFLEFFGKWYRDGGRPFRPLNIKTKYVDIKED